jgi:hypothetical protein
VEVAPQGPFLRFLPRVGVPTGRADGDDPVEIQHACRNGPGGKLDTGKGVRRNGILCQCEICQKAGVLGVGRGQDPVLTGEKEQPVAGTPFLAYGGADGGGVIAPALGRPERDARRDEHGQYGDRRHPHVAGGPLPLEDVIHRGAQQQSDSEIAVEHVPVDEKGLDQ